MEQLQINNTFAQAVYKSRQNRRRKKGEHKKQRVAFESMGISRLADWMFKINEKEWRKFD